MWETLPFWPPKETLLLIILHTCIHIYTCFGGWIWGCVICGVTNSCEWLMKALFVVDWTVGKFWRTLQLLEKCVDGLQADEHPDMLTLHGTALFIRPSAYQEVKSSPKHAIVPHNNLLGCSAFYNPVEGHHVQKPHIVPSCKVNFTRASHYLYRSLSERTTRHWLVQILSQSPSFWWIRLLLVFLWIIVLCVASVSC